MIQKMVDAVKKAWANPWVKIPVMAGLGASGGILAAPGTVMLDKVHLVASGTSMLLTLIGLFTQHPTNPAEPKA